MSFRTSRRGLLKCAAAGVSSSWVLIRGQSASSYGANEKLNVALVGIGNRGRLFLRSIPRIGENLVAVCDANRNRLREAGGAVPQARLYQDFRKMLDEMDRQIDALVIATPEHTHAVIGARAMKRGKHVYIEKPIAHDVAEARQLRQIARRQNVASQMGNQGMATDCFRRTLELILDGALGEIREVHLWFVFGGSGPIQRPKETPPVPDFLDWDLFLGPAPQRPFHPSYLSGWGAWRDFATGCLGGGGSHSIHLAFKGLKLGELWSGEKAAGFIRVETEIPEPSAEGFPRWQVVRFDLPARGPLPPVRIHWYNAPEEELRAQGVWQRLEKIAGRDLEWKDNSWTPRSGGLLVGSKGVVHTNAHNSVCEWLPAKDFPDAGGPPRKLPRAPAQGDHGVPGHEREWVRACKGGPTPFSCFDHSGPAMELLLLGNVASLVRQPLEFDPVAMKIVNNPEADKLLRPPRRDGWEL